MKLTVMDEQDTHVMITLVNSLLFSIDNTVIRTYLRYLIREYTFSNWFDRPTILKSARSCVTCGFKKNGVTRDVIVHTFIRSSYDMVACVCVCCVLCVRCTCDVCTSRSSAFALCFCNIFDIWCLYGGDMISMMDYACMCSIDAYVHKASSRNINLQCHQRSQRYVEFLSPSLFAL